MEKVPEFEAGAKPHWPLAHLTSRTECTLLRAVALVDQRVWYWLMVRSHANIGIMIRGWVYMN